ncbi:type II secretion system protein GspM [Viridibacterium curvum]|uniref:Type II secretion system protein M n=1 Tax=Viridibacterium curvum TaxID=1101404 RepID=A0ABP9QCY5_9RHOO
MNALRERFDSMSQRERRILVVGGVAIIATLLWLLHDWQTSTHKKLDKALPRIEAQLATMQAEAAEISRLRSLPPLTVSDLKQTADAMQASAQTRGLSLTARSDGNQILVMGKPVNFDIWVSWLGETLRTSGLRLSYLDANQSPSGLALEARFAPLN